MELTRLHTTAEVMEALGLSRSGLMSLVETGALPAVKVCRQYRFHPRDVESLVEAHTVKTRRPDLRPVADLHRAAS